MRILKQAEQLAWLAERRLAANPIESGGDGIEFYLQFYPPKQLRAIEAFTHTFLATAGARSEVMMTITDTENPEDYELRLFDRLRFPSGDPKSIFEAPVHLFGAEEHEDLIPMFSLTVAFQWEAYLHILMSKTILLNWESDIFDLWTDDRSVFASVSDMLRTFCLSETNSAQPGGPVSPDSPSLRRGR